MLVYLQLKKYVSNILLAVHDHLDQTPCPLCIRLPSLTYNVSRTFTANNFNLTLQRDSKSCTLSMFPLLLRIIDLIPLSCFQSVMDLIKFHYKIVMCSGKPSIFCIHLQNFRNMMCFKSVVLMWSNITSTNSLTKETD